jgi:hypothetical protein
VRFLSFVFCSVRVVSGRNAKVLLVGSFCGTGWGGEVEAACVYILLQGGGACWGRVCGWARLVCGEEAPRHRAGSFQEASPCVATVPELSSVVTHRHSQPCAGGGAPYRVPPPLCCVLSIGAAASADVCRPTSRAHTLISRACI